MKVLVALSIFLFLAIQVQGLPHGNKDDMESGERTYPAPGIVPEEPKHTISSSLEDNPSKESNRNKRWVGSDYYYDDGDEDEAHPMAREILTNEVNNNQEETDDDIFDPFAFLLSPSVDEAPKEPEQPVDISEISTEEGTLEEVATPLPKAEAEEREERVDVSEPSTEEDTLEVATPSPEVLDALAKAVVDSIFSDESQEVTEIELIPTEESQKSTETMEVDETAPFDGSQESSENSEESPVTNDSEESDEVPKEATPETKVPKVILVIAEKPPAYDRPQVTGMDASGVTIVAGVYKVQVSMPDVEQYTPYPYRTPYYHPYNPYNPYPYQIPAVFSNDQYPYQRPTGYPMPSVPDYYRYPGVPANQDEIPAVYSNNQYSYQRPTEYQMPSVPEYSRFPDPAPTEYGRAPSNYPYVYQKPAVQYRPPFYNPYDMI